jgi:hypothetical protein
VVSNYPFTLTGTNGLMYIITAWISISNGFIFTPLFERRMYFKFKFYNTYQENGYSLKLRNTIK